MNIVDEHDAKVNDGERTIEAVDPIVARALRTISCTERLRLGTKHGR